MSLCDPAQKEEQTRAQEGGPKGRESSPFTSSHPQPLQKENPWEEIQGPGESRPRPSSEICKPSVWRLPQAGTPILSESLSRAPAPSILCGQVAPRWGHFMLMLIMFPLPTSQMWQWACRVAAHLTNRRGCRVGVRGAGQGRTQW